MAVRAKVEHLYICQELYSRTCYVWMKFMLPPTFLSISVAIIIAALISVRFTELPFHFYIIFPFLAFMGMFSIFWMAYDIVLITRDSEYMRGQLLSHESTHLRRMSKYERTRVVMRAKAMRVTEFPVGNFADFSLNLPIAVWDEVVNQVLFLLSL